jgi:capsular polysaccharide biosynthesis protein
MGAAGLVLGLAYTVVRPPVPTATALVILPSSSLNQSGSPTVDVKTQVVVATSTPVLSAAGKAVSPAIDAVDLGPDVTAKALSQQLFEIQVKAGSAQYAEELANAVASSYIAFVTGAGNSSTGTGIQALQQQVTQYTKDVATLQGEINAVKARLATESSSSVGFQTDTALLGSLADTQGADYLQLQTLNNQISGLQQGNRLVSGEVRLVGPATVAPASRLRVVGDGAMGMIVALLAATTFVLVRARRDPRLRLRDEIATAIGIPVLGSLRADRCKTAEAWRKLLENYQPSASDAWTLRRLINRIGPGDSKSTELEVVAFSDDGPAIAAGPQLAAFATKLGLTTALVPSDQPTLEALRAASQPEGRHRLPDGLVVSANGIDRSASDIQLTVLVSVLEREHPEVDRSNRTTWLSLSSGFATTDGLARLALGAAEAGRTIEGIIVVNPESSDPSSGRSIETANPTRTERPGPGRPFGSGPALGRGL